MSEMGSERSANVVLTADVTGYTTGVKTAATETETLSQKLSELSAQMDRLAKSGGTKLQFLGAGTLASITATTAAYAVYEKQISALNVTSAVTGKSLSQMANAVHSLRSEFPVATREVAELVNYLSKVSDGTRSISELGETFVRLGAATGESTTGLTVGLTQLQRQMGTSQRETQNYANVLVELSQKSGVSAQGILEFSSQIAPIGRVAGMTTQEVMGISSAFAQAGQDGFMAANAFNKMLNDIMQSVVSGNPDLAKYANLIGVTVEQFQKMDKTKAITQVFEELNRMGPNAIQMLNRMGLDGMRTMKSITAMTQQTGGIGKAVMDANAAYGQGGSSSNALNRGSDAANKGLIDQLTQLKNTMAQTAEAMGENFAPAAEMAVKSLNLVGSAARSVVEGPLGKLAGVLMSAVAAGGLLVGTLFKLGAPLAALATGAALLRNFGTGGFLAGRALSRGTELGKLATKTSTAVTEGRVNPVQRAMWHGGSWLGERTSRIGAIPGPGGAGSVSRVLGMPFHGGAALARFISYGFEPLMHPVDPSKRTTLLPHASGWRESFRALRTGQMTNAGFAARQFGAGTNMALMGGHHLMGGIGSGVRNLGRAMVWDLPMGMLRATGGLAGMAGTAVGNRLYAGMRAGFDPMHFTRPFGALGMLGSGLGRMGGFMAAHPIMMAAGLGLGAYSLAQNQREQNAWWADDNKLSFMDAYAKSVGAATTATDAFANALNRATGSIDKPPTAREAKMITPKEQSFALSDEYSYAYPDIAHLGRDAITALVGQLMGGTDGKGADPSVVESLGMDLTKRFGNRQEAMRVLRDASWSGGRFNQDLFMEDFASIQGFGAGNFSPVDEVNNYKDAWKGALTNELNIATQRGGLKGGQATMRGQFSDFIGSAQKQYAERDLQKNDLDALYQVMDQYFFGAKKGIPGADLGSQGGPGLLGGHTINVEEALKKGSSEEAILDIYRQLQSVTLKSDEDTYDAYTRFLKQTGQTRKSVGEALGGRQQWVYSAAGGRFETVPGNTDKLLASASQGMSFAKSRDAMTLSGPEKLERMILTQTKMGETFMQNPFIAKALDVKNSENANVQIEAVEAMVAEMSRAKMGLSDMIGALEQLKNVIQDPTDQFFILADAAQNAATQLASIRLSFASPSQQSGAAVDNYFAIVDSQGGGKVHGKAAEEREAAKAQADQAIISAIGQVKQWTIQTREFDIAMKQAANDHNKSLELFERDYETMRERSYDNFAKMRERQEFEYNLGRKRSIFEYNLSVSRAEEQYAKTRVRQAQDYETGRRRALEDYNLSRARAEHDYKLSIERSIEDYTRSRARAEEDFTRSQADAYFDYTRQRLWAEEDFNHQVELMVKESAKNLMNIYQRVMVQRTWSATSLLSNAQDQLKRLQEQTENLNKLREMGVSKDTIQQLDLTNPNNAQQLQRFVADLSQDPKLIQQWNAQVQERLKAAGALVKDDDNAAWEEMQRQYKTQVDRAQEVFETQVERSRREFKISLERQAADFNTMMRRGAIDHGRTMSRQAKDFATSMARAAKDQTKMLKQQAEDFELMMKQGAADQKRRLKQMREDHVRGMKQQAEDFATVMKQQAEDHEKQVQDMIDAYEKQTKRARNQFNRTAKDITMSIGDIFKSASRNLRGHLRAEMELIWEQWDKLQDGTIRRSDKLAGTIDKRWGVPGSQTGGGGAPNAQGGGGINRAVAEGGVLPGFTPGRDVHTFTGPAGSIHLSGGEAIMRPEWTRAIGGEQAVKEANLAARAGKKIKMTYADGGVVDKSFFLGGVMPTQAAEVTRHSGYDWATWAGDLNDPGTGDLGDPVLAWKKGVVAAVEKWTNSYGWHIRLNHPESNQSSLYAHLSGIAVSPGMRVSAGQHIGRVGNTGNSSGPHLHFEIKGGQVTGGTGSGDDSFVDPRENSYDFEKHIEANDFLSIYMGGNRVSKYLNRAIGEWARKNGIDLVNGPAALPAPNGPDGVMSGGGSPSKNITLGQQMAAKRGWVGDQWLALRDLWTRESGWSHTADNPSSSAYGIPQGLVDLHKIAKPYWERKTGSGAGSHYYGGDPGTQIGWGLNYIAGRYGTPRKALDYWNKHRSYAEGGIFTNGMETINVGERGPEVVLPLNDRGADFIQALLKKQTHEAKRTQVYGTSVPMSTTCNHYKIDKSSNFNGAVTVMANDPREFAEKMRVLTRRQALTNPVLNRRNP